MKTTPLYRLLQLFPKNSGKGYLFIITKVIHRSLDEIQ